LTRQLFLAAAAAAAAAALVEKGGDVKERCGLKVDGLERRERVGHLGRDG
jgi:hypothetical protein